LLSRKLTCSTEEQHFIRRTAVQRYNEGKYPTRIAESYGVANVLVHRWVKKHLMREWNFLEAVSKLTQVR
jgi:transposase-like protein